MATQAVAVLPTRTAPAAAARAEDLPSDAIPLTNTLIRPRSPGLNVYASPAVDAKQLGLLRDGQDYPARALLWREYSWLNIPWPKTDSAESAWAVAEDSDFARSTDYTQVVEAWYQAKPVLDFRRALLKDLLTAMRADSGKIAQVDGLDVPKLIQMEDEVARQTLPPEVRQFWSMQAKLGLPAPFEHLPVQGVPPAFLEDWWFSGFGPTGFAFDQWPLYYEASRGMHSGADYVVDEGSPLIAVADGVMVPFEFLTHPAEESLALRPFLPPEYRTSDGKRVLSNVVVGYGHLTGDPTSHLVKVGDVVRAGQIIGTSGWPVYTQDDGEVGIQGNNAHLHLEVHFVTGGNGALGNTMPFNPLLFWSPRLIAFQARLASHVEEPPYPPVGQPFGRLGFFTIGCFSYEPNTILWEHTPSARAIWPEGVYDLKAMLRLLATWGSYPLDGAG